LCIIKTFRIKFESNPLSHVFYRLSTLFVEHKQTQTNTCITTFSDLTNKNFQYIIAQVYKYNVARHDKTCINDHTAQCIGITKRMGICFSTFYCCYGNNSRTIRCKFENGRVAALKGLFNVLNNNKLVLFFDILTQNMLKEIDSVFYMNYLAFIFSELHLNLKMIILTSFSFPSVLTSCSNFTIVFLFKCSYLNNYTR